MCYKHSSQKHLEEPLSRIYIFDSVAALTSFLKINYSYIQVVESNCGISYLFIGLNSAYRY